MMFRVVSQRTVDGWLNFKIQVADRPRKHVWSLAHNGHRLAGGRDLKLLVEHEPRLAEEITEWLESAISLSAQTQAPLLMLTLLSPYGERECEQSFERVC